MSWQILISISVITASIAYLLQRVLLHDDKSHPIAYAIVFQALVGVVVGIYALLTGLEVPDFRTLWFPIALTCVLFAFANIASATVLQRMELSVFSILLNTRAFWAMLFGVLLFQEHLEIIQLFGALLIFLSICLAVERKGTVRFDKNTLLGLLTGLIYGLAVTGLVYVNKRADEITWTALSFIGPALLILIAQPRSVKHMRPLFRKKVLLKLLALAFLMAISVSTFLLSLQTGSISLIAPLHATTIIVTVLLAIAFLRERTRLRWKSAAAIVCFMGVLLIV